MDDKRVTEDQITTVREIVDFYDGKSDLELDASLVRLLIRALRAEQARADALESQLDAARLRGDVSRTGAPID